MKKMLRYPVAVLLILSMLLAGLVGCGNKTDTPPEETTGQNGSVDSNDASSGEGEEEIYVPDQKDYDGEVYKVLVNDYKHYYLGDSASASDAISSSLVKRANLLNERLGIEYAVDQKTNEEIMQSIPQWMAADEDIADAICMIASSAVGVAILNGFAVNVANENELNLSASYWDQNIQIDYAINGDIYLLDGDFTIVDELRTQTIVYNKNLYDQYDFDDTYGSIYDLVREKKWTYEKVMEMTNAVGYQDRGTAGLDINDDVWGMLGESATPYVFFIGSGYNMINTRGESGMELNLSRGYYESIYSALEKSLSQFIGNEAFVAADSPLHSNLLGGNGCFVTVNNLFASGKALFRATTLSSTLGFGSMQDDFGPLPIPMYTEGQDRYYCWTTSSANAPMFIPTTTRSNGHLERTLDVTEALCYYSRYTENSFYDAFYEKLTISRLCRSAEDYEMLELIFASKFFDFDGAMGITGMLWQTQQMVYKDNMSTLSGTLSTARDSGEINLSTFLLNYMNKNSN